MPSIGPLTRKDLVSREIPTIHGLARYGIVLGKYEAASRNYDNGRLAFLDRREVATQNYDRVSRRSRDLIRVALLIIGLGIGDALTGEQLTDVAIALISLTPALIFLSLTWQVAERLHVVDVEADRAIEEQRVIDARRTWLTTAARTVPLLHRALKIRSVEDDRLNDALARLAGAEKKLQTRTTVPRLVESGWGVRIRLARRCAMVLVAVGALIAFVFAVNGETEAAVFAALIAGFIAAVRLDVCRRYVENRAAATSRVVLRNKQRDLLADLDKTIRSGIERLLEIYEDHQVVIDLRES